MAKAQPKAQEQAQAYAWSAAHFEDVSPYANEVIDTTFKYPFLLARRAARLCIETGRLPETVSPLEFKAAILSAADAIGEDCTSTWRNFKEKYKEVKWPEFRDGKKDAVAYAFERINIKNDFASIDPYDPDADEEERRDAIIIASIIREMEQKPLDLKGKAYAASRSLENILDISHTSIQPVIRNLIRCGVLVRTNSPNPTKEAPILSYVEPGNREPVEVTTLPPSPKKEQKAQYFPKDLKDTKAFKDPNAENGSKERAFTDQERKAKAVHYAADFDAQRVKCQSYQTWNPQDVHYHLTEESAKAIEPHVTREQVKKMVRLSTTLYNNLPSKSWFQLFPERIGHYIEQGFTIEAALDDIQAWAREYGGD